MKRISWMLPVVVFAALVYLNTARFQRGSVAFEDHVFVDAFATSRGWPFRAYAPATDEAAVLIDVSVVEGSTRLYRGMLGGPYPHLTLNLPFLVLDAIVAAVLMLGAFLIASRVNRPNRKSRERKQD